MIARDREYMAEPVPGAMLASVCREHQADAARLEELRREYGNERRILQRQRSGSAPNNRLAHGFARYISTMASGYLIGEPVRYSAPEEEQEALEEISRAYSRTGMDSVDAELAKDASVFGRGVELTYADERAEPRSVALEPEDAFVVYDTSATAEPLFGVYTRRRRKADGSPDGFSVYVYTDTRIYGYRVQGLSQLESAKPESEERHWFGGVPMVEFWNSEDERGDFEQVRSLIDAYDTLESDRMNDKDQFCDAILTLTGASMEAETDEDGEVTATAAQQIKRDRVLMLPEGASASFLTSSLNEADVEVLREAIAEDIHKFSMVPDLTDEHFSGNASGVAMRYKLLGFEQLMRIKERWFREGLKERLKLYAAFLGVMGAPRLDVETVTMTFKRSLPVNELETAQMVRTLEGLVPRATLLGQVPFVEDPVEAEERLKQEEREREAAAWQPTPRVELEEEEPEEPEAE